MLLSSMAWFTSLFCLMILVFSCCFKVFRCCLLGGGQRRKGQGAEGGRISHADWSPVCGSCSAGRGAAAMFTDETAAATKGLGWRQDADGGEDDNDSACFDGEHGSSPPRRGNSNWTTAQDVPGGDARLNSPGVSRF